MRIDARLPVPAQSPAGHAVQSVTAAHAVKPLAIQAYAASGTVLHAPHRAVIEEESGFEAWQRSGVERRKAQRRVSRQPILIELRSGRDRRSQMQCDSELCSHIDAEA